MLDFCDREIVDALRFHLRDLGMTFRFGEVVTAVERRNGETLTTLKSGKQIAAEAVFYSAGRRGATRDLGLENAGLEADSRGRIAVGPSYRTATEGVYAAGDVIGFRASRRPRPSRGASHRRMPATSSPPVGELPFGVYSIPEIGFVGKTELELTEAVVPYEVGVSYYRELARGQILGDSHGLVKLLVSPESRKLLGVHALGMQATEVVHIGQAVMALGGTIDFLVDTVFNYPPRPTRSPPWTRSTSSAPSARFPLIASPWRSAPLGGLLGRRGAARARVQGFLRSAATSAASSMDVQRCNSHRRRSTWSPVRQS